MRHINQLELHSVNLVPYFPGAEAYGVFPIETVSPAGLDTEPPTS